MFGKLGITIAAIFIAASAHAQSYSQTPTSGVGSTPAGSVSSTADGSVYFGPFVGWNALYSRPHQLQPGITTDARFWAEYWTSGYGGLALAAMQLNSRLVHPIGNGYGGVGLWVTALATDSFSDAALRPYLFYTFTGISAGTLGVTVGYHENAWDYITPTFPGYTSFVRSAKQVDEPLLRVDYKANGTKVSASYGRYEWLKFGLSRMFGNTRVFGTLAHHMMGGSGSTRGQLGVVHNFNDNWRGYGGVEVNGATYGRIGFKGRINPRLMVTGGVEGELGSGGGVDNYHLGVRWGAFGKTYLFADYFNSGGGSLWMLGAKSRF